MIRYNYFGIDFDIEDTEIGFEGPFFVDALNLIAGEKYSKKAKEMIENVLMGKRSLLRLENALKEFTATHRQFPNRGACSILWINEDLQDEDFKKRYRIVVASGIEDRETGQIFLTDFQ